MILYPMQQDPLYKGLFEGYLLKTKHFGINLFTYNTPLIWNSHIKRSNSILDIASFLTLKKYLKEYFIGQYVNNIL